MKRSQSSTSFLIKVGATALFIMVALSAFIYTSNYYGWDSQQNLLRVSPYESDAVSHQPKPSSEHSSLESSIVQQALKTLPNLSLLSNDDIAETSISHEQAVNSGLFTTAVPARALFEYQPNDDSGPYLVQPAAVKSYQAVFSEAASNNYPLQMIGGYVDIDDSTIYGFETSHEPPAGYSLRHTGYVISFGCGSVDRLQFSSSICHFWLMRNNAEVARQHGLVPLDWLKFDSSYSYSDYEFMWVGPENLLDFKNIIE